MGSVEAYIIKFRRIVLNDDTLGIFTNIIKFDCISMIDVNSQFLSILEESSLSMFIILYHW